MHHQFKDSVETILSVCHEHFDQEAATVAFAQTGDAYRHRVHPLTGASNVSVSSVPPPSTSLCLIFCPATFNFIMSHHAPLQHRIAESQRLLVINSEAFISQCVKSSTATRGGAAVEMVPSTPNSPLQPLQPCGAGGSGEKRASAFQLFEEETELEVKPSADTERAAEEGGGKRRKTTTTCTSVKAPARK
jgi:hypothetical protein